MADYMLPTCGRKRIRKAGSGNSDVGKSIKDKSYGRMHLNLPAVIECLHITWRVLKSWKDSGCTIYGALIYKLLSWLQNDCRLPRGKSCKCNSIYDKVFISPKNNWQITRTVQSQCHAASFLIKINLKAILSIHYQLKDLKILTYSSETEDLRYRNIR